MGQKRKRSREGHEDGGRDGSHTATAPNFPELSDTGRGTDGYYPGTVRESVDLLT